ncbi:hypothetical protein FQZ97_881910 [compost metagenome]
MQRLFEVWAQRFTHHSGGKRLVGQTGERLRNGVDGVVALRCADIVEDGLQHGPGFVDAVESQKDLQHEPVGFRAAGDFLRPGARRSQRRFTRAGLQRHLDRTAVEVRITLLAGRVQDEGVACSGLACTHIEFAQQQLVEKRRVQCRVDYLSGVRCSGWRWLRCCRSGLRRGTPEAGGQCESQCRLAHKPGMRGGWACDAVQGIHRVMIMEGFRGAGV